MARIPLSLYCLIQKIALLPLIVMKIGFITFLSFFPLFANRHKHIFYPPAMDAAFLKQKVPLGHRQHICGLAGEQLAIYSYFKGFRLHFNIGRQAIEL